MMGHRASSVPRHVPLRIGLPGRIRGSFGSDDQVPGGKQRSPAGLQLVYKVRNWKNSKERKTIQLLWRSTSRALATSVGQGR